MNYLYQGDIPKNIKFADSVAIDTEAMVFIIIHKLYIYIMRPCNRFTP